MQRWLTVLTATTERSRHLALMGASSLTRSMVPNTLQLPFGNRSGEGSFSDHHSHVTYGVLQPNLWRPFGSAACLPGWSASPWVGAR